MANRCKVCDHRSRSAIDRVLVARREGFRQIAARHRLSVGSLYHYYAEHLPAELLRAEANRATVASIDVMGELQACMARVQLLADACDAWLRDPEDPTRYDIGPRSEDVKVTYWAVGRNGKPVRKKRKLSLLLKDLHRIVREFEVVEVKHADPRTLFLKAAEQLRAQLELVAKLVGKLRDGATVNVFLSPEWQAAQRAILDVLTPHPKLRVQVAEALERAAHASRN